MSVVGVSSGRQVKVVIILEGVFVSSLNKFSDFFFRLIRWVVQSKVTHHCGHIIGFLVYQYM